MKRTRSYYKQTIPAKRFNANGTWRDSITTPRIMDLSEKLYNCLRWGRMKGQAFLECLEEEECTQEEFVEVAQLRPEYFPLDFPTMLHFACIWLQNGETDRELEVVRKLIEADRRTIWSRSKNGNLPLHIALFCGVSKNCIELLVNTDPSTLLVQNYVGDLPLHYVLSQLFCCTDTIQFLCKKSDRKRKMLDTKNGQGQTPIHKACTFYHSAFPVLAEERIQLVEGLAEWREQLRGLVKKYEELKVAITDYALYKSFANSFIGIFQDAIAEYESLFELQVMALVELAVWKGRGLADNPNERMAQRITSGAHHVATQVAGFLGIDANGLLQAKYDRILD